MPSWGNGLLYHHVRLLRERGFEAYALHQRSPFRMSWIDVDVPVRYLDAGFWHPKFKPHVEDVVVVPEVQAHSETARSLRCRRVVFVQGSFLMQLPFESAVDYRAAGFEAGLTVMPHIEAIMARHCGLTPVVIPPFVASYFFCSGESLAAPRTKRVLLAGKPEYRKAGYLDFDIVDKVLHSFLSGYPDWVVTELAGLPHRAIADLMQDSAILVNLNTLESFNATVPEAMAAGCIVFCYEAYGGRDYLRPRVNARVWPNNYVYPLLDDLCDTIATFDSGREELAALRRNAHETACGYREEQTAEALAAFYGRFLARHSRPTR